jgi:hypothetical protein
MDYLDSKIILVDDNNDYGYICSRLNDTMYAKFWAKGYDTKGVSYYSPELMYDKAKQFLMSELRTYSPLHIAQDIMFQAYIKWYDEKYNN